jgi:hypothetical protein
MNSTSSFHTDRNNHAFGFASSQLPLNAELHQTVVNHELYARGMLMTTAFQQKLQQEQETTRVRMAESWQQHRKHLSVVIDSYINRFKEMINYFDELEKAKLYIKRLRNDNVLLRLNAHERMSQFESELQEMHHEEVLLQKVPPSEMVQFLKDRILLKDITISRVSEKIETVEKETEEMGPRFIKQLQLEQEVAIKAAEALEQFVRHTDEEMEITNQEKGTVDDKLHALQQDVAANKEQLMEQKMMLEALQVELKDVQDAMRQEQTKYKNLVVNVACELDRVLTDLRSKTVSFAMHLHATKGTILLCMDLDVLGYFLKCPVCMEPFETPYILWPCGHTLCIDCLNKGVFLNETTMTTNVHCLECEAAFKLAQQAIKEATQGKKSKKKKDNEESDVDGGDDNDKRDSADASGSNQGSNQGHKSFNKKAMTGDARVALRDMKLYPNPYFRKPDKFNFNHYACKNSLVQELSDTHKKYSSLLKLHFDDYVSMMKQIDKLSELIWPDRDALINGIVDISVPVEDAFKRPPMQPFVAKFSG